MSFLLLSFYPKILTQACFVRDLTNSTNTLSVARFHLRVLLSSFLDLCWSFLHTGVLCSPLNQPPKGKETLWKVFPKNYHGHLFWCILLLKGFNQCLSGILSYKTWLMFPLKTCLVNCLQLQWAIQRANLLINISTLNSSCIKTQAEYKYQYSRF